MQKISVTSTLLLLPFLLIIAGAVSPSLYYTPDGEERPNPVYLQQQQQYQQWQRLEFRKDWWQFKSTFGRSYRSYREESARMQVFIDNMLYIKRHNKLADRGLKSYRLGVNQFADLTHAEFLAKMTGFRMNAGENRQGTISYISPATKQTLPDTVDWRQKGAVTSVKNQGQCGSCWTFSSTGALEGQQFRKTGVLLSLSEQQLLDCSSPYGTLGCQGGWMEDAFNYVKDYGIELEADYPYTGKDGTCLYRRDKVAANCTGVVAILAGSEEQLQEAVANVGPVSVAIDASHVNFQLYKSGVYSEPTCSRTLLDHAVLVIGYGNLNGADYWLVKNSWGVQWGMQGYILMSRNNQNQCGIASHARYPTV